MPSPRCRPFTILDAMILVAATAAGIAAMRPGVQLFGQESDVVSRFGIFASYFSPSRTLHSYWEVFDAISWIIRGFQPLLLAWTVAFLILRLKKPRPIGPRLVRQPGFAAASVVVLISLIDFLGRMSSCLHFPSEAGIGWLSLAWYFNGPFSEYLLETQGAAVAAAWMVMALGRALRPEPSWIDRGGRVLGVLWLVLLVLEVSQSQPD